MSRQTFQTQDYDLGATLTSGQAFRWRRDGDHWTGVIGGRWVRLLTDGATIAAETAVPVSGWRWLMDYLQLEVDLPKVLETFPQDTPMKKALNACRGLRLLRQDPWECLASFILSSTKRISQIEQVIGLLCERYGESVPVPLGDPPAWSFPSPSRLAQATEAQLRGCRMGFRAPHLWGAARQVATGALDLDRLGQLPVEAARARLTELSGVGRKIADCVLLFAYGFQTAFPVDVWVAKALQQLYFGVRRVKPRELHEFAAGYFGPNAGYAQQYLFHYMRTKVEHRSPENSGGRAEI